MRQVEPAETVYTWESDLRRPGAFLRHSFQELKQAFLLGFRIFYRDLRAQHRETFLGLIWVWVPALTVSATFVLAEKAELIAVSDTGIPYPAYVIISTILWQVFAESLAAPVKAIEAAKPLLAKVRFPAEAMIISKLLEMGLGFLVKLPLLIGILVWFRIAPNEWILAFPLGVLSLVVAGAAIGIALVPVGGLYQDVGKSIPLVTTFWMFLTPVVFTQDVQGLLGRVMKYNPVTPLLVTTRDFLCGSVGPQIGSFFILSGVSLLALVISWLITRISIPIIVERAGN